MSNEALSEKLDDDWKVAFKRAQLSGEIQRKRAAAMSSTSLEDLCSSRRDDATAWGSKARELKYLGSLEEAWEEAHTLADNDALTLKTLEDLTNPDNKDVSNRRLLEERQKRMALRMKASLMRSNVSIQQSAPHRIINAYRISKELARIKGDHLADQTLAEALQPSRDNPDPWKYPTYIRSTIEEIHRTRRSVSVTVMKRIEFIQKNFRIALMDSNGNFHTRAAGMTYSPPTKHLRVQYEPKHKHKAQFLATSQYHLPEDVGAFMFFQRLWHDVMKMVSDSLYLERGSKKLPELGEFGLVGLFDPFYSGSLWPPHHELIQFEEMLLEESRQTYMKEGPESLSKLLKEKYGLLMHEEKEIRNLMLYKTKEHVIDDIDVTRAETILRLESLIDRTKDIGDTRAELAAIKTKAQITGLFQETGRETMDDFIDAMVEVSKQRDIDEGYIGIEE